MLQKFEQHKFLQQRGHHGEWSRANWYLGQGSLYTGGRGWYPMCSCQLTVELAVASLKDIFHDSKSAKPLVA